MMEWYGTPDPKRLVIDIQCSMLAAFQLRERGPRTTHSWYLETDSYCPDDWWEYDETLCPNMPTLSALEMVNRL